MPRQLALLLCLCFIVFLWYFDHQKRKHLVSNAIWLPVLWMLVLASRPLSFWLGIYSYNNIEGNAFDRYWLSVQIVLCLFILARRGFSWSSYIFSNKAF